MGVHYNVDHANDRPDELPGHIIDMVHGMGMGVNTRKKLALSVHILDYSRRSDYTYRGDAKECKSCIIVPCRGGDCR